MAPRQPLTRRDPNIAAQTTVSKTAAKKTASKPATKKVTFTKPEPTLEAPRDEVDVLRAQIEDLTAKLEAATIDKKDVKPIITTNPFSSSLPSNVTLPAALDENALSSLPILSQVGPPPKRPSTAYQLFSADQRDKIRENNPEIAPKQVIAELAKAWNEAPEDVRKDYEARTIPDRERYEAEKAEHDAKVAAAEEKREAVTWMQSQVKHQRAMEMYEAHIAEQAEKEMKKASEDDDVKKPKKPRSAYTFYQMLRHEEMSKKAAKSGTSKATDATTIISNEWKTLGTSSRKKDKTTYTKCHRQASEDLDRYEREMEQYKVEIEAKEKAKVEERIAFTERAVEMFREQKKEKDELSSLRKFQAEQKKVEKEEKAAARAAKKAEKAEKAAQPKRPRNAYALYFADKAKDADFRAQSEKEGLTVAGKIGAMWKELSDTDRAPFAKAAADDRLRYENEMAQLTK